MSKLDFYLLFTIYDADATLSSLHARVLMFFDDGSDRKKEKKTSTVVQTQQEASDTHLPPMFWSLSSLQL